MPPISRREYLEYAGVAAGVPSLGRAARAGQPGSRDDRVHPTGLRVDHEPEPLGLDTRTPSFGWRLSSEQRGQVQTAYRILVASDRERLDADRGDVWDSGTVASSRSTDVAYDGAPLRSRERYVWKVRVRDADGRPSEWSDPAAFEMGLLDADDWDAAWIGRTPTRRPEADDAPSPAPAPLLRTEFEVDGSVERARVYVTGLGLYDLRLNGSTVGDRELDPAVTDYDETVLYATYGVTDHLRQGDNAVGVELGNGFHNFTSPNWHGWATADWRGDPKLLFQLEVTYADGTTECITSDGSWRVASGPTVYNNLYEGETYDARLERSGFAAPGYDDSNWTPARLVDAPKGDLTSQPMPPMRVTESFAPESVHEPRPGVNVFDVGRQIAGWGRIELDGPPGAEVTLQYGEKLNDDGTVEAPMLSPVFPSDVGSGAGSGYAGARFMRDEYVLSGAGTEVWEPTFSYKGFRYVQVSGLSEAVSLEGLTVRRVHTDVDDAGSFACSDDLYDEIHEATRQTIRNNLHGIPTDTPVYEKAGWCGDVHVVEQTMLDNFDLTGFFEKWLDDFPDSQRVDGELPVVVPPSPRQGWGFSPVWSGVYPSLVLRYYRNYGDRGIIEEHYDPVADYVEYVLEQRNPDGTVNDALGDWKAPGYDQPPEDNRLAGTVAAYKSATEAGQMADLLGNDDDARRFERAAGELRTALNEAFFDEEAGYYSTDQASEYRQTSNVLPLAFDLVPEGRDEVVVESLVADIEGRDGHLNTGILGTSYLLSVLTGRGRHDVAHTVASQRTYPSWGWWLENGATTLWEGWDLDTRSRDHFFFGSIDEWLYRDIAGIDLDRGAPGYGHTTVSPQPGGGVTWARATRESPHGTVRSRWQHENGRFELTVRVPVNTSSTVRIPTLEASSVRVRESDRLVWNAGTTPGQLPPGIDSVNSDVDAVVVEVGSGEYDFTLTTHDEGEDEP